MQTREIPRDEWAAFFDSFSRQHEGWLATVEVLGEEVAAQVEARELSPAGSSADKRGGDQDTISIIICEGTGDHITHTVTQPAHVRLEQTDSGADEALQIESANGEKTILRFRATMLPEMVDGIVHAIEAERGT
jgi:hypothetical protein